MTRTTATCRVAAFMPEEIKGMMAVVVDVVNKPYWTRDKMTTVAKQT